MSGPSMTIFLTLIATNVAMGAWAQAPEALELVHPARMAALGNAGAAAVGSSEARSLNPALAVLVSGVSFGVGYHKAQGTDVAGVQLGAAAGTVARGTLSIDIRQRQVENLIDDPNITDVGDLKVANWGVRVGYARRLRAGRVLVGASVERVSSTVFGTEGTGWTAAFGGAVRLNHSISVAGAILRLGPKYEWKSYDDIFSAPLGRALVVGAQWQAMKGDLLSATTFLDGQVRLEEAASSAVRFGAEILLSRLLALRAGYEAEDFGGSSIWERSASAGVGFELRQLRLDVARDRLGREIGQRTIIAVTYQP